MAHTYTLEEKKEAGTRCEHKWTDAKAFSAPTHRKILYMIKYSLYIYIAFIISYYIIEHRLFIIIITTINIIFTHFVVQLPHQESKMLFEVLQFVALNLLVSYI